MCTSSRTSCRALVSPCLGRRFRVLQFLELGPVPRGQFGFAELRARLGQAEQHGGVVGREGRGGLEIPFRFARFVELIPDLTQHEVRVRVPVTVAHVPFQDGLRFLVALQIHAVRNPTGRDGPHSADPALRLRAPSPRSAGSSPPARPAKTSGSRPRRCAGSRARHRSQQASSPRVS